MKIITGIEVQNALLEGKIIFWNSKESLAEKRLYRHNKNKGTIEYSDNNLEWKKSLKKLDEFEGEWIIEE